MSQDQGLDRKTIQAAVDELDALSRDEYGCTLEALLLDTSRVSAPRVQRLVGIVLKRPFATKSGPNPDSETKARRSWPWKDGTPENQATLAPKELAILNEIRRPGSWHEPWRLEKVGEDGTISWNDLKDDAENERGLFKVLALYVDDRLKQRDRRSFAEYLDTQESRRFEAGLDLTTLIFDTTVTAPLVSLLGIPTLAVGLTLVLVRYGYRVVTDPDHRVGDARA